MAQRANEINPNDPLNRGVVEPDAVVIRETEVTIQSDDPEEIRAGIEHTRAEMSETINAIQERLSPENIKEQAWEQFEDAKQSVRDATIGRVENMVNDARYGVMETIRQNPIPAALVGIGLGWMFMNGSSGSSRSTPVRYSGRGSVRGGEQYSYDANRGYRGAPAGYGYENQRSYRGDLSNQGRGTYDRATGAVSETYNQATDTISDTYNQAADTVSDAASRARETVSDYADRAQDTMSDWAHEAQYQAQRVEDRFQEALHSNPLAVGAVALAIGTAVGLALPQTERENELMGETRDNLLEQAQSMAQDTVEKVQRVAENVTEEAKDSVQQQAREQGLTS
jgi:ElaB/YqjD/DUF883 family membrane-anchored ribosome-binding protein